MIDINQSCGGDLAMYTNIKALCCTPNNIIMLYVNCTSIKNNNKEGRSQDGGGIGRGDHFPLQIH